MTQLNFSDPRFLTLNAELLTAPEVASLLRCSIRHVWRSHAAGTLPAAVRIGRLVRWPKSLMESWIAEGCPKRPRPRR